MLTAELHRALSATLTLSVPEEYATLLDRLGFVAQTVRLHVYAHVLEPVDAVVE